MNYCIKIYVLLSLALVFLTKANTSPVKSNYSENSVDLIVFSFDRPLQLYAFLESVNKYSAGLNQIYVIYRVSGDDYNFAYQELQKYFNDVVFVKQGKDPKKDFKPLLLECFNHPESEYVVFAVDDIIVKDYFDFSECVSILKNTGAYGFYLRLGKNIVKAYSVTERFNPPPLTTINSDIFMFQFNQGKYDWAYPNTVDMTVYKKADIKYFLANLHYSSPNTLEGAWASKANLNASGLCFSFSKIINIPLNIVQQDWDNPHNNSLSLKQLFEKWKQGLKIDIDSFFLIKNESPHIQAVPIFVERCSL